MRRHRSSFSSHIEGYLAGTFANAAEGPAADEVCAFYLPLVGGQ